MERGHLALLRMSVAACGWVISCISDCVFVYLSMCAVCAVRGKWLELSTPKYIEI